MPPPAPLSCSVTTCDYETPTGTPSWELMSTLLGQHTDAVHKGSTHPTTNQHVKLEKLPRPVFSLNMSESQWNFKILQWNAYIQQTETDDNVKLMQLQAACDDQLRQRVFDSGVYSLLTTPDLFLQKMKELAVITVHTAVHLRNLWKMEQSTDENIRAFAARVTATADMCNMKVKCICDNSVSYRD